jgi:hypothetical protein
MPDATDDSTVGPGADWRFPDREDTEVIVLARILRGAAPLRLVTHDEEDGGWQFLDGDHVFDDDAVVVCLGEMVQFDPSLRALADLPAGGYAWRRGPGGPWSRARGEPPGDLPP